MKRIKELPEKFIYTSVVLENNRIHALGYDLEANTKVYYSSNTLPDLAYYTDDYSNSDSKYKTYITNKPLKKYPCKTISDYKNVIKNQGDIQGYDIHGDFNLVCQWINQACGPNIKKNADEFIPKSIQNINIGYVDIEVQIGKTFPSPQLAEYPITAITLYCSRSKTFHILTDKEVSDKGKQKIFDQIEAEKKSKHKLHNDTKVIMKSYINNEEQMIVDFARLISEVEEIDILTGWNSSHFDVPYIYFRTKRLFGEHGPNMMSPLGKSTEYYSTKKRKFMIDFKGINLIDSMIWYQDFTRNIKILPSYSLDYVSQYELKCGKAKLPGTLKETYERFYDEYVYYNMMDVIRLVQLMETKKFFEVTIIVAYKYYSCLFKDVQSPVVGWESIVYQNTYPNNLIFEKRSDKTTTGYPGAYVHVPTPGFYKDVITGDVNSMYPHIHIGWLISPETHITDDNAIIAYFDNHPEVKRLIQLRRSAPDHLDNDAQAEWWDQNVILPLIRNEFDLSFLKDSDICMTPSLEFFYKDENAIMPKQFKTTYSDRKVLKSQENEYKAEAERIKNIDGKRAEELLYQASLKKIEQIALKIVLNAGYGAVGSPMYYFRETRISRSITLTGRYIIQSSAHEVSNRFREFMKSNFNHDIQKTTWIYSDTDAVDLTFEELTMHINKINGTLMSDNERCDMLESFWNDHVQYWLNDHFASVANKFNSKNVIVMKREMIALSGIWRDLQKHYALLVIDNEGTRYHIPEVHMKGTQFVSTSIPEKCKEVYDEIIDLLLRAENPTSITMKNKIIKIIDDFRGRFKDMPLVEICEPIGTNKIEEYIDKNGIPIKGAPHNVKAANTFNQFIKKNNLVEEGIQPIQSGTKIRIFPLKKGNPYNNDTFGFINELPRGFDVRYIDYQEMFNKNFLKYVTSMFKELSINWNLEEQGEPVSMDAF